MGIKSIIMEGKFNTKQTIILQHFFGNSLIISNSNKGTLSKDGNHKNTAQWVIESHGQENDFKIIKFKNKSNGKYLRIIDRNNTKITDCLGTGGKYTKFKVHQRF